MSWQKLRTTWWITGWVELSHKSRQLSLHFQFHVISHLFHLQIHLTLTLIHGLLHVWHLLSQLIYLKIARQTHVDRGRLIVADRVWVGAWLGLKLWLHLVLVLTETILFDYTSNWLFWLLKMTNIPLFFVLCWIKGICL